MSFDLTAPFQAEFSTRDQFEHKHKVHPVQIFAPYSAYPNRIKFNESALSSVLGHSSIANKKVVIISVAGTFRKGKSFLLNIFLDYLYSLQKSQQNGVALEWLLDESQLEGFHWRSGVKRDTTGVWIWGEPIMIEAASGETYAVVLMDTQGTMDNSSSAPYQLTNSIFTLSTILSCAQFYNVSDAISAQSLENLLLFIDYTKMSLDEASQFGLPLQTFVFVVRDFKSADEHIYGLKIGEEHLNDALRTFAEQSQVLRHVCGHLKESFDELFCYLLPHPGHRMAEHDSFKGYVKEIKPLFKEEVKKLASHFLNPNVLQPKVVNGKSLTCKKTVQVFRQFAHCFESCVMLNARNIFDINAKLLYTEAANEAKMAYTRGMDKVCSKPSMLPQKKLHEAHIRHGIIALNIFEKCQKIGGNEIRSRFLSKLQQDLNSELERYKRLNEDKRITGCSSRMTACGDSVFFGMGLGSAASLAIGGAVITLQAGMVSAGVVAVPISLTALLAIWTYVYIGPKTRACFKKSTRAK